MTFNIALTGLRSANTELEVSGNNIANASTVGFKQSRAEFADVYANTTIGGGSNSVGSGVRVADIAQQFSQGNIGFTDNALDLAINGSGFFVLSDQGAQTFSRAGQFGLDNDSFIVNNSGARLQGFVADAAGNLSGAPDNLQISVDVIPPQQTSQVDLGYNLDSRETVIAQRGSDISTDGGGIGTVQAGTLNGYLASTVVITDVDGNSTSYNVPSVDNQSAAQIAALLRSIPEVTSAAATTSATLTYVGSGGAGTAITSGDFILNGQAIAGGDINDVVNAINDLNNITASAVGATITVIHDNGEDLEFSLPNAAGGFELSIDGAANVTTGNFTKGGSVDLFLQEGNTLTNPAGLTTVFTAAPPAVASVQDAFDPARPNTYNAETTGEIFDSLGVSHDLRMFFVKESAARTWTVYVQIDGQNVGDPNPGDPTNAPTLANYTVRFDENGALDTANSDDLIITNWTPLDAAGIPNGALPPINGAGLPIPVPATSSNFLIDVSQVTQFGADSAPEDYDQTGFATGRFANLDIDETGVVFARYTNGQALLLGQIALADFDNPQGLTPVGDTAWAESFQSGSPVVGAPLSASRGAVSSGALEDSNVDIAEELVALIIAQRNFQANARTIETANEVTQTVINLR